MIKATFACLAAAAVGAEVGRSVAGDEDNLRRRRCRELVRHGDPLSIGSSASWRRDSSKASNSRRREIGEEESIRTIPIAAPTIALVALTCEREGGRDDGGGIVLELGASTTLVPHRSHLGARGCGGGACFSSAKPNGRPVGKAAQLKSSRGGADAPESVSKEDR